MELFIIGLALIALGFILQKILDRRGSRWSNLALVICFLFGFVCIGFFAGLD